MHVEQDDVGRGRPDALDGGRRRRRPRRRRRRRPRARRARRRGPSRGRRRGRPAARLADRRHGRSSGSTSSTSVPSPGAERTVAVPPEPGQPAGHRVAQPPPVVGHRLGVEALAAVADEHRHPLRRHLRVEVGRRGARVLGRVDQGLAGRRAQRGQGVVQRGVADDDRLDGELVVVLDLGDHAGDQPGPRAARSATAGSYSQVRSSRSWLRASRPTASGSIGVPLDQGQGLQHRVVQVRGDRGPLLGADRGPPAPRPAESSSRRHSGAVASTIPARMTSVAAKPSRALASCPVVASSRTTPPAARATPAASAHRHAGQGEGAVGVELPPDDRQTGGRPAPAAGRGCRCRSTGQLASTDDRDEAEERQPEQLACCWGRCGRRPRRRRVLGRASATRHGQPEQAVGDDADAGGGQHDERDPDDERVQPQVGRRPGRDAGEHPAGARARERRARRRAGRRGEWRSRHDRRTGAGPADTGDHPEGARPDQGRIRAFPDGIRRSGVARLAA